MATTKKLMGTTAVGGALAIEDVFSTYLYTGNGSTQTITNGIDLAGEGGLVWFKNRGTVDIHALFDSERPLTDYLRTNGTNSASTATTNLSFNSNGFSLNNSFGFDNAASNNYASWSFRKAPRFFDVVTYTGTGSARTVSHNLGVAPGCIIAKNVSRSEGWRVYHRSQGATKYAMLQSTNAFAAASTVWNNTEPTDSVFTTGSDTGTNGAGDTIVAYLFAHDPLGPSGDGSDGLIACGSMSSGSVGNNTTVDLGWEPQWILFKNATGTGSPDWWIYDTMRGWTGSLGDPNNAYLFANTSGAEGSITNYINITPTGFVMEGGAFDSNATFIYIAIRRGPMRQPESGTEVFKSTTDTTATTLKSVDVGFPTDFAIQASTEAGGSKRTFSRLAGNSWLTVNTTNAESAGDATFYVEFDQQNTFSTRISDQDNVFYNFRRAPGFFDVVAYTGDGVAGRTVSHNLGVAPEMMWVKSRSNASTNWQVYHQATTASDYLVLNGAFASIEDPVFRWYNTAPTDTVFTLGEGTNVNSSGYTYIAYLFATLPGVSKVGSYTGNGSSQTINCGFTSGARFVLIKRTDSTGDWYVWDTARGIVAGNDPHLSLNTTAAEVTSDDTIDPASSGFIVNQVSATNVNVSSASYIFYAIA